MEQAFKSFVPSTFQISLFHLIASTPKNQAPADVQLNNVLAAEDSAVMIASGVADLAVVALADSAVAAGADGNN